MINQKIDICKEYGLSGTATLETFVRSSHPEMDKFIGNLPAMIVCPGGGYAFLSEREAEPIALEFFNRNYNTFVLRYNIDKASYPQALTELACSVDYVRKNADKFNIDKDKIYVCGFSAGGHLVGCLANLWSTLPNDLMDVTQLSAKPNAVILSYPVIYPQSHIGSYTNLLGDDYEQKSATKTLTLNETVNDKNPPCFIWTTAEDTCVLPDATIKYTAALCAKNIKFESHIFATGWHGGATCDERTSNGDFSPLKPAAKWFELADVFLKNL